MLKRPYSDLPPVTAETLPRWPANGLKQQHSVEYWMMASLLYKGNDDDTREAVRVLDPKLADLFFVPFFSSLSFNTHGHNMTDADTELDRQLQSTQGMRSSKFCLHPAGDTPSSCRLFDAIVSHRVPVIMSDNIELSYEDELDYTEFSVVFSVKEALTKDYKVNQLRQIAKERWLKMWRRLKEISLHYEFQYPPKKSCQYAVETGKCTKFPLQNLLYIEAGG